jgi:hypothetical protein
MIRRTCSAAQQEASCMRRVTAAERLTRSCYSKQSARCYDGACTRMPAVLTALANASCPGCAASMLAVVPYHSSYGPCTATAGQAVYYLGILR